MTAAQRVPTQRVPKGTPLPLRQGGLSVLSYNLLAPLYVRPIDQRTGTVQAFAAFEWAAASSLDWEVRRPALLRELAASGADLICLQEVQFERSAVSGQFALPEWLRLPGYEARVPPPAKLQDIASRNLRVLRCEAAIGNVLLWRADRLTEAPPPPAPPMPPPPPPRKDGKTKGQKVVAATPPLREQSVQRVGCVLQGVTGGGLDSLAPVAVFSVHLDATSEEKRVKQLAGCLEIARSLGTRELIIAGDMNTPMLPGSAVRALTQAEREEAEPTEAQIAAECADAHRLKSGEEGEEGAAGGADGLPSPAQMKEWRALLSDAGRVKRATRVHLSRVPTGGTRAAWEHGASAGPCVAWSLDHILFTRSTLRLSHYWETLEGDATALETGLPNAVCPSDHLPVAACFELAPRDRLGEAERAALAGRVRTIEVAQAGAWGALQAELDRTKASVEAEAGIDPNAPKGKRGRPPDSVVACIRQRREEERALKADVKARREALVHALSEAERDFADDELMLERGGTAAWCERSPA